MKLAYRFAAFAAAAVVLFCAATAQAEEDRDIFTAARLGDVQRMTGMLEADPDLVDARTPAGETPLHYAAMGRSVAAVDLLLQRGADVAAVDDAGRTALHVAATSNDSALIARLLEAGAEANAPDGRGETPLHAAARRFRAEAVAALLTAGANPNARNVDGQTPLHVLGSAARDADGVQQVIDDLAAALIAVGADPTLQDDAEAPAWPHPTEEPGMPRQPSGYPSYDSIVSTLLARATTYPSLCQRVDLGPSSSTQHIYALKITDNVGVEEDEPEFKYVSTMHGDEVTGVVMCLNLIDYLLTNYGTDSRVTNIVNSMEIWIVPCMNPHGYADNGRYNANGYDLNRSFPEGSGPSPDPNPNPSTGLQPEVNTIINWSFAHSFTLAANYHGGALVTNYPYDDDNPPIPDYTYAPTPDDDLFIYISEQYSYYNPPMWGSGSFYHGITNGSDWYIVSGGMQDWNYRYMGCNEVTIEVSNVKSPAYSQMPTFWNQNRESMLAYMETCLTGVRGIVTGSSGEPVAATVTVAGRNHAVYTDPQVGDYHRMLMPGTYNLTFTAAGYTPITVNSVVVGAGAATRLDVSWGPHPPTATNVNAATAVSTQVAVTLTATDDGLPNPPAAMTYLITALPGHGSLADPNGGPITAVPYTLAAGGKNVTYQPEPGYRPSDTFKFKANDGGTAPEGGDSNEATVTISIGGSAWDPVAYNVNASTAVSAAKDVTLNAVDPNGDPLTYLLKSLPASGFLSDPGAGPIQSVPYQLVGGGKVVTYQPPCGEVVVDSFTYTARDLTAESNVATATVSVALGAAQLVYSFPLDSDPGWSTQGLWEFGHPTGSGSHNQDPNNGHTGTNVYGYNLFGDYTNSLAVQYLTTTAIDCTNLTNTELRFWRWLGVEGYFGSGSGDLASIQVSNNGSDWRTIWQNGSVAVSEAAWSLQTYIVSAAADQQATVYFRWGLGPTDSGVTYPGWNIDDVEIWGAVAWMPVEAGDVNLDGTVNGADIGPFVEVLLDPASATTRERCAADMEENGVIDLGDLDAFVQRLLQP